MNERVGWGLVGLGRHADSYIAPAIGASDTGTLAAVCSRSRERAEAFARRHAAGAAYDHLDEMLQDPKIDCVFICSEVQAHEPQVIRVAEAGRHVLCEKPLGVTEASCLRMAAACDRYGVALGVGFHLRTNPALQEVVALLASEAIGDVLFSEIQYVHVLRDASATVSPEWRRDSRLGPTEFLGSGLHAVDLVHFFHDAEVAAVRVASLRDLGSSGEQVVQVTASLESGVLVSLSTGRLRFPANAATFYGTDGRIRARDAIGNVSGGVVEVKGRGPSTIRFPAGVPYKEEVDRFGEAIRTGSPPCAGVADAIRAARVVAAIAEAASSRREVRLS